MIRLFSLIMLVLLIGACVPAKKYNDLLQQQEECSESLKKYKTQALDNEGKLKTVEAKAKLLTKEIEQLKKDTASLGSNYRSLKAQYDKSTGTSKALERELDKIKDQDARELARTQADLEAKIIETQRKEDALIKLEQELRTKQNQLAAREKRVKELEEIIQKQELAVKELKEKIAKALLGFKDKGLTVEERNGKIYVSLEAKLLFASGSTVVEPEGQNAVIQLAKAIQGDDKLEIIVEGHTDSDALKSRSHPKNNWELSVLRATSVISIMTENTDINPKILMAAGRSEHHPVDEFNKAKNRRIEVIIAPNLDELFTLISKE